MLVHRRRRKWQSVTAFVAQRFAIMEVY